MLSFEKIQEVVERFDGGQHLLIRSLKPNRNISNILDLNIIEDIIKSRFHHWKGEENPDGLTVSMSSLDQNKNQKSWDISHHKFYGFFDNSKISFKDYKYILYEDFKTKLFSKIEEWNEGNKVESIKAIKIVDKVINQNSIMYSLNLDENKNIERVAKWHTYSVFIGFLAIDKVNQVIILIEFGQD